MVNITRKKMNSMFLFKKKWYKIMMICFGGIQKSVIERKHYKHLSSTGFMLRWTSFEKTPIHTADFHMENVI
jgi:hypothetical protein